MSVQPKQHLDLFSHFLHSEAELSRVTDRQTDTAIIGNNSLHLMHSMQPKKLKTLIRRHLPPAAKCFSL